MRVYTNARAWRAHMLLWLFSGLFVVAVLGAAYALVIGDGPGLQATLILAGVLLACALGMEFYCRRYITALDLRDGYFLVETKGLVGTYYAMGIGEVGAQKNDNMISMDRAAQLSFLTDSLRPIQFAAIDNQYHMLKVGPQSRRYILDVTADPEAGERIGQALEEMRRG